MAIATLLQQLHMDQQLTGISRIPIAWGLQDKHVWRPLPLGSAHSMKEEEIANHGMQCQELRSQEAIPAGCAGQHVVWSRFHIHTRETQRSEWGFMFGS